MGIMDIVKKAATGATDEENRKNREKMREIFDGAVADGSAYKLLYCKAENYTDILWAARSLLPAPLRWCPLTQISQLWESLTYLPRRTAVYRMPA